MLTQETEDKITGATQQDVQHSVEPCSSSPLLFLKMPLQIKCPSSQIPHCPLAEHVGHSEKNHQTCGNSGSFIVAGPHGNWFLSTQNMVNKPSVTLKTPERFPSTHLKVGTPKNDLLWEFSLQSSH